MMLAMLDQVYKLHYIISNLDILVFAKPIKHQSLFNRYFYRF
jgi:hypothetical protein